MYIKLENKSFYTGDNQTAQKSSTGNFASSKVRKYLFK